MPRRLTLVLSILGAALLPATAASAATMHVDRNHPNCSNSGSGTAAQPFCTISAAASRTTPDTTVLVASGTYNEQVSPKSGSSGSPVVFEAAPGATVNVTGGTYGFYLSGRSWVTVKGFHIADTNSDGIYVSSSSRIELIGNRMSDAGEPRSGSAAKGIRLKSTTDSLVSGNTVDHNSSYGLYLETSNANTIVGNLVFSNAFEYQRAASGIRLYGSSNNTISSNVSHHNEDSGIEMYTNSNNNLVVNNITYDNEDHGIDVYRSPGQSVISNTVYRNVTSGINVEGNSTGVTLANNIAVDNAINSPRGRGNVRIESGSTSQTTMDYGVFSIPSGQIQVNWNGSNYQSLSAFVLATGQELHGIQGNPGWVSPATGNFHLSAGSPAIDSANSGASGQSSIDAEGNPRVNDPATPNTGAGPRAFDDRGAYEFQPVDGPPVAALDVTPPSGTAPLTVTADASGSTDPGSSPISSYRYDFGDGIVVGPQAGASASHTYTATGTFTVTVTVTDTAGQSSTATDQVTVTEPANDPPNAAADVTPASGAAPLHVTADAGGSAPGSSPISTYRYDFGDGTVVGPQVGTTASHTYTATGTFTVTITVTDTAGRSATAIDQVTVTEPGDDPPSAALSVTPSSGLAPLEVTADASGSTDPGSAPISTYRFDFGDGTVVGPQAGATATHTYTTAGTRTVTVTVTDTAGQSSTATRQVTVTANLVANPGFETNTTGWNTTGSGSNITLARVAGGHSGGWAARLANTGSASSTCALNDSPDTVKPTASGSYTGTVWVRSDVAGATLKLRFREYSGTTLVGTAVTITTLTTAWQQVSVSHTIASPGSSLDLNAYVSSAASGTCFYVDDIGVFPG